MSYIVYCYTNNLNNKKYIGITSRSLEERERNHIYESRNKSNKCYNSPFKRAIRKYGIQSFNKEILDIVDTLEEACELEKYYIEKFQTYYKYKNSNGYNATIGGELLQMPKDRVVQIDKETLDVIKTWNSISEAEHTIGGSIYEVVNDHTRQAINSYWFYERYFDQIKDSYKESIRIDNNYICQISSERKLIKIWSGSNVISRELGISQGNISSCCIGIREMSNSCYWCFYTDFLDNNFPIYNRKTHKKKVVQFSLDGELLNVYESVEQAAEIMSVGFGDISRACTNHTSSNGYLWRRASEYNGEKIEYTNYNRTSVEKLDENKNVIFSVIS